jgi:hypothetical protein
MFNITNRCKVIHTNINKCLFCKEIDHNLDECISEKIKMLDEEAKDASYFSEIAFKDNIFLKVWLHTNKTANLIILMKKNNLQRIEKRENYTDENTIICRKKYIEKLLHHYSCTNNKEERFLTQEKQKQYKELIQRLNFIRINGKTWSYPDNIIQQLYQKMNAYKNECLQK